MKLYRYICVFLLSVGLTVGVVAGNRDYAYAAPEDSAILAGPDDPTAATGEVQVGLEVGSGTDQTGYNPDEEFEVEIRFSQAVNYAVDGGNPIDEPSDVYDTTLKSGDSFSLSNIPEGVTFTVAQTISNTQGESGYSELSVTPNEGTITSTTVCTVEIVDKYEFFSGSIQINGVFSDTSPYPLLAADDPFVITVQFSEEVNYVIDGQSYLGDSLDVDVTAGNSATISGIPVGTSYTIEQIFGTDQEAAGYSNVSISATSGTISKNNTDTITVTNERTHSGLIYNVRAFGAVPNDDEDDARAFQNALNKALSFNEPITVVIPSGTYHLAQNLKIFSNTTIQAADDATIIADYGYDGGVSIISGSHQDADGNICSGNTCTHGGYTAIENITIHGGVWDRNIATDSSSAFIFRHGNNITIENLTVKNCTDHFINVSGCNNVTISYVNFQDAKKCPDGEHYWEGWTSRDDSRYYISEAVHTDFTNEEGEKSDYAKPWDNTPARNITVDHCTFTNVHAGVGNHHNAVGDRGGNFTVTNNTFDNVGSYCFYGCDYDTVVFSNNTATDCNTMILVYGCSKVTVSDNTMTSTHGGSTDDYKRDIIHFNNVSTGTIKNNTISGAQNSGIQVCEGSKNIIIDNNKVNSSNAFGILARGASAITCKNNKVNGTTVNDAIKYESCSGTNKIMGNTITSAKYDGINVTNSVTTEVSGNTISGVGNRGISVMSSNNTTIKSNTITSAPQAGITIEGTSAAKIKVTCSDNIIKKPGADGIMVKYADQSTISNNKITSPGNDGINVADSNKCSVTDNEISSAVKRGIVVSRSNGATVKNNTITSPKLSGIWIEGSEKAPSAVTCNGNKITNPGEYGVGLKYADGSSVTNIIITKPVKDGINASASKNCKINNNEISNAGRNGIGLSCSKGTTVNANKISSPTNNGIYSEGTTSDYTLGKITAKNNTITSSGADGISVKYGDSSVVNDNTITKAGRRGIMIKESANCTVNGNTIKSTTEIPIFVEGSASKKASANVSDNTLQTSDNTKVDLRTGTNSTVRISGNTFMNNKTYSTADGSETIDTGSSTVITPKPTVITPTPTVKPAIAPTVIPTPTTAPKPTTAPQNTETGVESFVERLYTVALGRDSDPYGKADWVNRVRVEGATGADLARGFLFSDEFLNKNMSNSDFLDVLYETFFNRPADEHKADWLALMDQGWSKTQVIDGFINSIEWANLCLNFGIASGSTAQPNITVEPSQGVIDFATRLYTTCLGRDADRGGLNDWSSQLANMKISGSEAAHGFFFSGEFIGANYSDSEYVQRLYRTFMGREYDQGGYDYWMNALASGKTREDVFQGFSGSAEWAGICADYGILK